VRNISTVFKIICQESRVIQVFHFLPLVDFTAIKTEHVSLFSIVHFWIIVSLKTQTMITDFKNYPEFENWDKK
jgi:hypothetical protein